MKKLTSLFLVFTMIFVLGGCGGSSVTDNNSKTDEDLSEETVTTELPSDDQKTADNTDGSTPDDSSDASTLVIYFSRIGEQYTVGKIDKGNTAIVAEMIADKAGADLFEVVPADDVYPTDDYNKLTEVAKQEQNDNARPEYASELPELSKYDLIFIGSPVWWGDWPMIMYTVFENNDFSGKKLVPFSTHEGSGLSGFDSKLQSACPNSEVLTGLAVRGNDCQNDQDGVRSSVDDWLSGLGY